MTAHQVVSFFSSQYAIFFVVIDIGPRVLQKNDFSRPPTYEKKDNQEFT
jgi:hypothetical protein